MTGRTWLLSLLFAVGCGNTTLIVFEGEGGVDTGLPPPDAREDTHMSEAGMDGGVSTLASGLSRPLGISLSPTEVYWSEVGLLSDGGVVPETGAIARAPRAGGASAILVPKASYPEALQYGNSASTGETLVWSALPNSGGTVNELQLASSDLSEPGSSLDLPLGVAMDENNVYWVSSSGDGLLVESAALAEPDGGATSLGFTDDGNEPRYLAITPGGSGGERTIFATGVTPPNNGGALYRLPIGGGPMQTVWSIDSGQPYGVAVDSNNVYWAVANGDAGVIYQGQSPSDAGMFDGDAFVPDAAIASPLMLAQAEPDSYFIAVDSKNVYFTTNIADGGVYSVPIGGGAIKTLAVDQSYPGGIAVDDTDDFVYFTTLTSIARVHK